MLGLGNLAADGGGGSWQAHPDLTGDREIALAEASILHSPLASNLSR